MRGLHRFVDERWADYQVCTGLSSGEGLIHAVRDPQHKPGKDGKEVLIDPGEADKRLIAVEPEFARVLRAARRESNTLSAQMRLSWDAPPVMRTMTRSSPLTATGAHISVIGHVTADELRRELTEVETANGFANRFLWAAVRRSKLLPRGGTLSPDDLEPLGLRLREIVEWAKTRGELQRDEEFWSLWDRVYPGLTTERPGLLGAVTSRAEAQVLRLALVYALLDGTEVIGRVHLEAALALWRYCEASAAYIFDGSLGDPLADELLSALSRHGDQGMTRTEIQHHFGRHKRADEIAAGLSLLEARGLVESWSEPTGGRPAERWRVRTKREKRSKVATEPPSFASFASLASPQGDSGATEVIEDDTLAHYENLVFDLDGAGWREDS